MPRSPQEIRMMFDHLIGSKMGGYAPPMPGLMERPTFSGPVFDPPTFQAPSYGPALRQESAYEGPGRMERPVFEGPQFAPPAPVDPRMASSWQNNYAPPVMPSTMAPPMASATPPPLVGMAGAPVSPMAPPLPRPDVGFGQMRVQQADGSMSPVSYYSGGGGGMESREFADVGARDGYREQVFQAKQQEEIARREQEAAMLALQATPAGVLTEQARGVNQEAERESVQQFQKNESELDRKARLEVANARGGATPGSEFAVLNDTAQLRYIEAKRDKRALDYTIAQSNDTSSPEYAAMVARSLELDSVVKQQDRSISLATANQMIGGRIPPGMQSGWRNYLKMQYRRVDNDPAQPELTPEDLLFLGEEFMRTYGGEQNARYAR